MRRGLLPVAAVALAAVLAGCVPFGTCDETAPRSASVPTLGATSVRIVAEAGNLEVHGQSGVAEVAATGTACALNAGDLDRLQFVTKASGSEVVIEARTEPHNSRFDVTIEVPDSFQVVIEDGSFHVGNDGSGDITVRDIRGDFVVDDAGSGDVRHSGIGGRVDTP